jgi:hypothetical protein
MPLLEHQAAAELRTIPNLIEWIISCHAIGTPPQGRSGRPGRHPTLPTDSLHVSLLQLYSTAGKPTMLSLREETGLSRMTFSNTLFQGHVPTWEKLQVIVTALGGDPDDYLQLWGEADQAQRERRRQARLA